MHRIATITLAIAGIAAAAPGDPQTIIANQVPAARAILDAWRGENPPTAERKLHLVYWTPADRDPAPRHRQRQSTIMTDIRAFYAAEMKRLGFGPLTIGLQENDADLLKIHLVKGRHPYSHYNVKSGGEIRTECLPVCPIIFAPASACNQPPGGQTLSRGADALRQPCFPYQ